MRAAGAMSRAPSTGSGQAPGARRERTSRRPSPHRRPAGRIPPGGTCFLPFLRLPAHLALAGLLLAAAAGLAAPAAAVTLVSNVGETQNYEHDVKPDSRGHQGFTTGTNSEGYTLETVSAVLRASGDQSGNAVLNLCPADANGKPDVGSTCTALGTVAYATLTTSCTEYTVDPTDFDLDKEKTYFVQFSSSHTNGGAMVCQTSSNSQTGQTGWSIADKMVWDTPNFSDSTGAVRIKITGTVKGSSTPCPTGQPGDSFFESCVTVGKDSGANLFGYSSDDSYGSSSTTTFDDDGTTRTVEAVIYDADDDELRLEFTAAFLRSDTKYRAWVFRVGSTDYTFADGTVGPSGGAMVWSNPSTTWNSGNVDDKVSVSLRDSGLPVVVLSKGLLYVNEGGTAEYTVELDMQPSASVTVDVASGDTAVATVQPARLTFTDSNWSTAQTVTVTGVQDADQLRARTTVSHTGTGVVNEQLNVVVADDDAPSLVVSSGGVEFGLLGWVEIVEGLDETVTVALSRLPLGEVTVAVNCCAQVLAVNTSTLTFGTANWNTPQTLTFTDNRAGDYLNLEYTDVALEPYSTADPAFDVANIGARRFNVDFIDPPAVVASFGAATYTVSEGSDVGVTVQLDADGKRDGIVVPVSVVTGSDTTATLTTDYTLSASSVTFNRGETSKTVTLTAVADAVADADETVKLRLGTPTDPKSEATLGSPSDTVVTIGELPTLSIEDASGTEGDSGRTNLTFTVTLSEESTDQVTVKFTTSVEASDTATSTVDFFASLGTLTFSAGQTSRTGTVGIVGDRTDEENETFTVTLSEATNATIADATGTMTITDNDDPPALSIGDRTVTETEGDVDAAFAVTLSAISGKDATVDWETADGTAVQPGDYTSASGTLTFTAGDTSKTVTVTVKGDTLDEDNETYMVNLSSASNATIGDSSGTGTITDNDAMPVFSIASASATEGGAVTFTVTLTPASGRQTTVGYDTDGGAAVRGTDFTRAMGTLTFAAGDTTKTFAVTTLQDSLDEDDETFTAKLTSASNATLSGSAKTATGTIDDNDPLPALSINNRTVTEGNSGSQDMFFTVSLTPVSGRQVRVDWETAEGTALEDEDYKGDGDRLTFAAGQTSKRVKVMVLGDAKDEPDETFTVDLSSPTNATVSTASGTGTITDNDDPPDLRIADKTVTEGDASAVDMEFTVSLSAESGKEVTVGWETADGTAGQPDDYASGSGTLTFAAGATSRTATVEIAGDVLDEDNETLTVTLASAVNASVTDATATGTITDNDPLPVLSIANESEDEDAGTMTFTVSLGAESGREVRVGYGTTGGTATQGTDYAAASGTLTFAAGDTGETFDVTLNDDALDEHDETFTVPLRSPVNATLSSSEKTATGTINDDDPPPNVSIADGTAIEPDGTATTPMTFAVTLDAVSAKTVNVSYATSVESSDTATSNTDFTAKSGTLTFSAGATQRTITVSIMGDDQYENRPTETFTVKLSTAVNVTIDDGVAAGNIQDDEGPPRLSIANAVKASPESGNLTFTVTYLGDPSTGVASANWATRDTGTDEEHATAGEDYTASSGSLTFPAQTTAGAVRRFTVPILSDSLDEFDEVFTLALSGVQDATLDPAEATGTITDDDAEPRIRIHKETRNPLVMNMLLIAAGDEGGTVRFPVTLSAASGRTVTVLYSTADSARRPDTDKATPGVDYTAEANTELRIPPGDRLAFADVESIQDTVREDHEYFDAVLASPRYATLRSSHARAEAILVDDEEVPELTIDDATESEDAGTMTFTVTLSAAVDGTATVAYATSGGTARLGVDYAAATGTLSFAGGSTEETIVVTLADDTLDEVDETFNLRLSSPSAHATLADSSATGTITDDDDPPAVSIADATAREDASRVRFTVMLAAESGRTATLEWSTADGTATAGEDYTAVSGGTLTFAAGETRKTIEVALLQDAVREGDETFTLSFASADGTVDVRGASAAGTITDDEPLPRIAVEDVRAPSESGTVEFTATLSQASAQQVTVNWATADGTATAGEDYTAVANETLTFAANDTEETFAVTLIDDTTHEGDEAFTVVLSGEVNAEIGRGQATATITDDDGPPKLSITDEMLTEGDAGDSGTMAFTVTLAGRPSGDVTVDYATRGGSATEGTDYEQKTGTLTFDLSAGEKVKTVEVKILGDDVFEGDEEFTVRLSNARTGTDTVEIVKREGTGTIDENELGPELVLSKSALTVAEGNAAGGNFTVALKTQPTADVTVRVTLPSRTDLTAVPAQLVFTAGDWSTAQTVTVTAGADGDAADDMEELTLRASSRDRGPPLGYNGLTETVDVTVSDPDVPGVTVTAANPLVVNEGDRGTYAVELDTEPTANVTVEVTGAPDGVAVSPARLTFTPRSWGAKTVTVRGSQDPDTADITATLAHTVTTRAVEYASVTAASVTVEVEDDDKPSLRVSRTAFELFEDYEEPFTVRLNTAPTANVSAAVQGATGDLSVSPSSLTFTTGNWSQVQTVTVSLAPDADTTDDGDAALTFQLTTTDADYSALPSDVRRTVTVTQKEPPAVTVAFDRTAYELQERRNLSVRVHLSEDPRRDAVVIPITATPDTTATTPAVLHTELVGGDYTVAETSVTFDRGETQKSVRVLTGVDDGDRDREALTLGFGAMPNRVSAGTPAQAAVTIVEYVPDPPPPPPVRLSIADAEAAEDAGAMHFTVTLTPPQSGDVSVQWSTADGSATAGEDYEALSGMLVFAAGETGKVLSVPLVDDAVGEDEETFAVRLSNALRAGRTLAIAEDDAEAVGTITDDDASAPPALTRVWVRGDRLTLSYDQLLDEDSVPAPGDFEVSAGAPGGDGEPAAKAGGVVARSEAARIEVLEVEVAGATVVLTLAREVSPEERPSVSYTPGTHPLRDMTGAVAPAFSPVPVTVSPSGPRVSSVDLFPSSANAMRQGFVRVVNHDDEPGELRILAIDDAGVVHGPVLLDIDARETVHFNSADLKEGNAGKGLEDGIGPPGKGSWRLELESALDLEVLSYIRTEDGFVTSMHDVVPEDEAGYRVVFFNPGSNRSQVSRLRLVNPGEDAVAVRITGTDDAGEPGESEVELVLGAGASRTLSAQTLESGGEELDGALGDGKGKWRLRVTADRPIRVMSLLTSPTGHLTNLSTVPREAVSGGAGGSHRVPLAPSALDPHRRQGFVRVVNHDDDPGEVSILAIDDAGVVHDPVLLDLDARETVHFNSADLEEGNAGKGLEDGVGPPGKGSWRLVLESALDLEVLSYIRTDDRFVTSMHDVVPEDEWGHRVVFFNPASNRNQVSRLRLVNPGEEAVAVRITGIDDAGEPGESAVELVLGAGASRTLSAQALESGDEELDGALGDGKGKWRLRVTTEEDRPIRVMSLLTSPTGHLTNLSTVPERSAAAAR